MSEIVRFGDYPILISLKDAAGDAIPVSDLADLEISLYQLPSNNKSIIQKWIMSDGQITTVSDPGGTVRVKADRAKTKLLKIEDCKLEVVYIYTDASYAGGIRRVPVPDISLAQTKNSPTA